MRTVMPEETAVGPGDAVRGPGQGYPAVRHPRVAVLARGDPGLPQELERLSVAKALFLYNDAAN